MIVGLSWRAGFQGRSSDTPTAATDVEAVARQVVEMIAARGFPRLEPDAAWLANVAYSLGVGLDGYIAGLFPEVVYACPEDGLRQWRRVPTTDPAEIEKYRNTKGGPYRWEPPEGLPETTSARWQFSSTYQLVPACYSPDEGPTVSQGATDAEYLVPSEKPFGDRMRRLDEVSFPAAKVMAMDSHDRHSGRRPRFYALPDARQPLLMFDGSVAMRRTADASPGFRPNDPASPLDSVFDYRPTGDHAGWNPPPTSNGGDIGLAGRYRWTRGGLRGRDFGPPLPGRTGAAAVDTSGFLSLEP